LSDGKSSHCLWQGELKKIINLTQQFLTRNFLEKLLIFSCKKIIWSRHINIPIA
jgi:hypothetical protein